MVPTPTRADKEPWRVRVDAVMARFVRHRVPLAWALALWVAVVGMPWLALRGEGGLDGRVFVLLALLGPALCVWVAGAGSVTSLYGSALVSLVPPLVAAPVLSGARVASPMQALVVAGLIIGLTGAVLDRDVHARHTGGRRILRALFRWDGAPPARSLVLGLGAAWLWMAWSREGDPAVRSSRVVAVALLWTWVLVGNLGAGHVGGLGGGVLGWLRDARPDALTSGAPRVEVGPAVAWRLFVAGAIGAALVLWWWPGAPPR